MEIVAVLDGMISHALVMKHAAAQGVYSYTDVSTLAAILRRTAAHLENVVTTSKDSYECMDSFGYNYDGSATIE